MTDFTTCANFFPEIQGGNSGCLTNTVLGTGACDDPIVITPNLVVSADQGNSIECRADGVYAAQETLCYRIGYSHPGELCVTDGACNTYEFFRGGTVVSLESGYLTQPSIGSDVTFSLVDPTGQVFATGTAAANSSGVTFSGFPITIANDINLGIRIDSVGSTFPGCGFSASFIACEPNSAFAPGSGTVAAGISTIDVSTDSCLTGTTSGSGTPLDPVVIDLQTRIDTTDATNILECRAGGLYVPSATVDGCNCLIEQGTGTVVAGTGVAGDAYTISGAVVNQGTNTITSADGLQEIVVPTLTPSTDSCNGIENRANGLYAPLPNERTISTVNSSVADTLNATPAVGTQFRRIDEPISNNDACGRDQIVTVTYNWLGFQVNAMRDGSYQMLAMVTNGVGSTLNVGAILDWGVLDINTGNNGGFRTFQQPGWTYSETFTLAAGASRTLSMWYQIGTSWNQTAGLAPVLIQTFTNQMTIDRTTV